MQRSISLLRRYGAMLLIVLLAILLIINPIHKAHAAVQATYYVSPTGSNSNSGADSSHPFATIDHARQVIETVNSGMTGDIQVYLLSGTYHESLTFGANDSGTNGHNIFYEAYPGAQPVLSGGTQITGWVLHDSSKNIWQAPISAGFNTRQLYISGVRAHHAQSGTLPSGTTQTSTGYTIPNTTLQNMTSPADLGFVYNNQWIQSHCNVASISGTTTQTTVTMVEPCFQIITSFSPAPMTFPTSLENAYEFLTNPGDWSVDTTHNVISYIPRVGENLATADVEAGNTQSLLTLNGTTSAPVQDLVFQGITFAYAGWLQPSQSLGMPEVQANLMVPSVAVAQNWNGSHIVTPTGGTTWNGIPYGSYAVKMPGAVEAHAALHNQFLGDTFTHLGAAGLDMDGGSQYDTITGNIFSDISGNGIQFGGVSTPNPSASQTDSNATITDNYVTNVNAEYQGGVGIFLGYVANTLVSHNEIGHLPYSGISTGWGWGSLDTLPSSDTGNTISDNYIHDMMQIRTDGGCIYNVGPQPKGVITGNFCQNDMAQGIYMDAGSTGYAMSSNVLEQIGSTWWLFGNANSWDPTGMTANGNYTDQSSSSTGTISVTNTTVFADSSVPTGAQTIIASAGLDAAYQYLKNALSPFSTSGLALWLKADAGVGLNGSTVVHWYDQSGNGNTASQATGSAQPTLVQNDINGYPALHFDGANTFLQTAAPVTTSTQYSMFVVSTIGNSSSAPGPVYNGNSTANGYGLLRSNTADYGAMYGGQSYLTFGTLALGAQMQELVRDGSGTTTFYHNSAQSGSTSSATPNTPTTATYIGGVNSNTSNLFSGDVAEVLIYNRALSTSERQQVEQYLTVKYLESFPTSGLALWLKADTGVVTNGTAVTQWKDQTVNGNIASQANTSDQPALVPNTLNGHAVVRFNGSSDYLATSSVVSTSSPFTIFVVSTLGNAPGPIYNGNSAGSGYGLYCQNTADYGALYGGRTNLTFGATVTSGEQLQEIENISSNVTTFYQNGTQSGNTASSGLNTPTGATYIGGVNSNASNLFSGDIAEVLIYNRALSTSERQQVEQYLLTQYGI
jgi:hypothetical protein